MSDVKKNSELSQPINGTSLAELIAQTPAAQSREEALAHIKARAPVLKPQSPTPLLDEHIAKPEPMPIIDNPDAFAADFFARLKAKEKEKQKPSKPSKPKLVIDNDKKE